MTRPPTPAFLPLLDLTPSGEDVYLAPVAPEESGHMYGGQFLAQSLAASYLTIDADRTIHSLHGYFLRPGDINVTTELRVSRIRDGRSFSSRQVSAYQAGKELFRVMASFNVPEPSFEYAGARKPDVPPPGSVETTYNEYCAGEDMEYTGRGRPMDILYINPPSAPVGEPVLEDQRMWMKIVDPLPDGHHIHDPALAYLSDSTLIDHVLLPEGQRWHDPLFLGVSLDHSMWFHRRVRADEWLLFDQTVEATGDSRGLATGRFFTADGALAATCKQEGLIRWKT
jgi:acyl-CoA thioesterase-2